MLELIKATTFPFMHHRKKAYIFSALVMLIGIASVIMKGGFQLSVDFAGGRLIEYRFSQAVSSELIRTAATSVGIAEAEVQRVGDAETDYIIRVPVAEQEARAEDSPSTRILEALQASKPGLTGEIRREELVGPKVGNELKGQATWAVTLSLLAILLYVAIRYEWRFAVGGVIALAHDVIVSLLMCSVFNVEISIPIVAALMTIGGYSINDTVVVFDRIREEMKLRQGQPLEDTINLAINRTLSRTILTAFTTLISIFCLYFLGGEVIHGMAFALLIGVSFGIYSSVYVASALALEFSKGHHAKQRAKVA